MKRPKLEDTRIKSGMSIGGNSVSVYKYSKIQDKYINYLRRNIRKAIKDIETSDGIGLDSIVYNLQISISNN